MPRSGQTPSPWDVAADAQDVLPDRAASAVSSNEKERMRGFPAWARAGPDRGSGSLRAPGRALPAPPPGLSAGELYRRANPGLEETIGPQAACCQFPDTTVTGTPSILPSATSLDHRCAVAREARQDTNRRPLV